MARARNHRRIRAARLAIGLVLTSSLALGHATLSMAQNVTPALGTTVDSLLAAGRQLSPTVRAAALETAAAAAKADAAGALDDPTLSTNYQNYRSGSQNFNMTFIMLSQEFPLWGKRDLRHQAALADVDAARGRERAAQDELDEQIKLAYARYYVVTQAIAINQDISKLARQMRGAATARYGQGSGDQIGAVTALTEQTRAATDAAGLEEELASAIARINALLARPARAALAKPLRLRPLPAVLPGIDALLSRARASNPTLFASNADIRGAEAAQTLAGKAWLPGVTIGAGPVTQTHAPTGVNAEVSINIPLQWAPKEAGEREAAARLGAAQQRFSATLAEIQGDLESALARLNASRRVEMLLRTQLLPQYQAAFRSMLANYGQGHGDLTGVLEIEHRLHDTHLELLRTQTDQQTALAAIERLIGSDL